MANRTVHVRLFNLDQPSSLHEYEQLLSKIINNPTKTKMLSPPEKIVKSFTTCDVEGNKETIQQIWLMVEYAEDDPAAKKKEDAEIFGK